MGGASHFTLSNLWGGALMNTPLLRGLRILMLILSILSSVFLVYTACKIAHERWRGKQAPPMGRVVDNLVLVLCLLDAIYYLPCVIAMMQDQPQPVLYLHEGNAHSSLSVGSVIYPHCRELVMVLNVFWHAHISRVMYKWIVLKESVGRLQRSYNPCAMVAVGLMFVLVYVVADNVLFRLAGMKGMAYTAMALNGVIFPAVIGYMLWTYLKTVWALRGGGVDDTFVPLRYVRTRRKLLLMSLIMSISWGIGSIADGALWAYAVFAKEGVHPWLYPVRLFTCRLIGIIDAAVLAGILDICLPLRWLHGRFTVVKLNCKALESNDFALELPQCIDGNTSPVSYSLSSMTVGPGRGSLSPPTHPYHYFTHTHAHTHTRRRPFSYVDPSDLASSPSREGGGEAERDAHTHMRVCNGVDVATSGPEWPPLDPTHTQTHPHTHTHTHTCAVGGVRMFLTTWSMTNFPLGPVSRITDAISAWIPRPGDEDVPGMWDDGNEDGGTTPRDDADVHTHTPTHNHAHAHTHTGAHAHRCAYDVYVVALQNCVMPSYMAGALHAYLGGSSCFAMYSSRVSQYAFDRGSSYVLVFVRRRLVENDAVQCVEFPTDDTHTHTHTDTHAHTHTHEGLCSSSSKEVAGVSLRIHGTTLAFISARVSAGAVYRSSSTSSSSTQTHTHTVASPCASRVASEPVTAGVVMAHMLQTTRPLQWWDAGPWDLESTSMHDHTFLLGSLRSELMAESEDVLRWVGDALVGVGVGGGEGGMEGVGGQQAHTHTGEGGAHEGKGRGQAGEKPKGAAGGGCLPLGASGNGVGWSWVSEYDELCLAMGHEGVLPGFTEMPLRFPPTCRWRRNAVLPQDGYASYTAHDRLRAQVHAITELESAFGMGAGSKPGRKPKPPSYHDRIVCHSLPDTRARVRMHTYTLATDVKGGDHKPVVLSVTVEPTDVSHTRATHVTPHTCVCACAEAMQAHAQAQARRGVCMPLLRAQRGTHTGVCVREGMGGKGTVAEVPRMLPAGGLWVYSVELRNFQFDTDGWGAMDVIGVSLAFPVPPEDPIIHDRKARMIGMRLMTVDQLRAVEKQPSANAVHEGPVTRTVSYWSWRQRPNATNTNPGYLHRVLCRPAAWANRHAAIKFWGLGDAGSKHTHPAATDALSELAQGAFLLPDPATVSVSAAAHAHTHISSSPSASSSAVGGHVHALLSSSSSSWSSSTTAAASPLSSSTTTSLPPPAPAAAATTTTSGAPVGAPHSVSSFSPLPPPAACAPARTPSMPGTAPSLVSSSAASTSMASTVAPPSFPPSAFLSSASTATTANVSFSSPSASVPAPSSSSSSAAAASCSPTHTAHTSPHDLTHKPPTHTHVCAHEVTVELSCRRGVVAAGRVTFEVRVRRVRYV